MTVAMPSRHVAAGLPLGWHRPLSFLTLAIAALLVLFRRDVADVAGIWWTSTTYAHCLFIAPIVAWLIWTRRSELSQLTPRAWWPGVAWVAVGAIGWMLGDMAGVAFARQFGVVIMMQGAVLAILGPHIARALLFPLAYLMFAVPFGDGLEPPLQQVTVTLVMPLLSLVGMPAESNGVLIHAGRYWFEVAEACSGAKFVIAMLAYAVLVANLCFTRWRGRVTFVAAAIVIAILANGLRAFATIWVANLTDVETATGADHIVYGWIFFAVVMALVMAVGWRWFDRAPDAPAFDPATVRAPRLFTTNPALAAALTLAIAGVAVTWSATSAHAAQTLPSHLALPDVPGWRRVALDTDAPWQPYYPAADHFLTGRYVDARGHAVDLSVAVFAVQREDKKLFAFGTGVLREGDRWVRIADGRDLAGGATVRLVASGKAQRPVERTVASWYRVGGMTTHDPRTVKLATLKTRLLGLPPTASAWHVSATGSEAQSRAAMGSFVAALGPIDRAADRLISDAR